MPNHFEDIVIVGGGLAGLFCALKLAPRPVTVVTAAPLGEGASSGWAQGGIAAAVAEGDTPEAHARDTVIAGAGLVDEGVALAMAREAPDRIRDLLAFGVPFDRDLKGRLAVDQEAAHSTRRIVHVRGDQAGRAIMAALVAAVRKTPSIRVLEGYVADDLITGGRRVTGLHARGPDGTPLIIMARAVVLASGGLGHLFAVTTNPTESRGHGLAIAARAGATIADPEFVQFHPTAINIGRDPAPLATEAIRGEGATLVNRAGARFMLAIHPDAELAPRDIVARGVFAELQAGRGAFLDARTAIGARFATKFPGVTEYCRSAGIDPARDLIPVAPAAHYHMGGVLTDATGRTSLAGLWAAGEVASTGAHGANRLASNSLLEAAVYAARIAEDISSSVPAGPLPASPPSAEPPATQSTIAGSPPERALRELMSRNVGVIRDGAGLRHALTDIARIERDGTADPGLRNMATAALMVTAGALARHESRGGHYRSDFPKTDPKLARRTLLTLDDARRIAAEAARIPRTGARMTSLLCPDAFLSPLEIDAAMLRALAEDLGRAGDVTSTATVPEGAKARAVVVARAAGTISGLPLVEAALRKLDPAATLTPHARDGDAIAAKAALMTIAGDARAVLAAERTALNFLGHLSGIATATAAFVKLIAHTNARVCCTRKTTPGLRALQKYAVRCGGGFNHRFGLDDAILIKDNHIAVAGGVAAVLKRAKSVAGHLVKIEIEVDTLDQLREVLAVGGADVALLDNMAPAMLREAVALNAGRLVLEASGSITLSTAAAVAETGVDYLSSGAITHSSPNLDIALDIEI